MRPTLYDLWSELRTLIFCYNQQWSKTEKIDFSRLCLCWICDFRYQVVCRIDRFSDDSTMPIVWFLLQIVVKFAHLNQW